MRFLSFCSHPSTAVRNDPSGDPKVILTRACADRQTSLHGGLKALILVALLQFLAGPLMCRVEAEPLCAPHVEVELVSENQSIHPGEPFFLGFRMRPDPEWHVYWKYAGDSGSAPKFSWVLSPDATGSSSAATFDNAETASPESGIQVDPVIHWPFPERIPLGPLMNYGYEEETLFIAEFPASVFASISSKPQSLKVTLDVEWLVCMEECIPGNALLQLTLPVSDSTPEAQKKWKDLFTKTRARWPVQSSEVQVSAFYENNEYVISFTAPSFALDPANATPQPSADPEVQFSFLPDVGDIIENATPQRLHYDGARYSLTLDRNIISDNPSPRLSGLLISNRGWTTPGLRQALAVDLSVAGVDTANAPGSQPAPAQSHSTLTPRSPPLAVAPNPEEALSLVWAIAFAFIGGLILNIMPCVFPVLSLKLLSFAEESGRTRRHAINQGVLFSLGVIGTFLLLAIVLIVLRSAGHGLGWGFQLQSPGFVLVLIFLMTGLALNLLGVFEMGAAVQRAVGTVQTGEGAIGSIGSGALAVLLATPCTAPFMGSALAYALTVPTTAGLTVFAALGVGMALPYMLLCSVPGLLKILPRPGAWMLTFKQFMAFPLFGTVIWLLWVLGIQTGADGVIGALTGLLSLGLGLWCLGIWAAPHRARRTRVTAQALCALLILLGGWFSFATMVSSATAAHTADDGSYTDPYGQHWEKYSDARLEELLAQGRPVYLDFTAAWCITCQVNKKLVFSSREVRDFIASHGITLMRGDWTNQDENITKALARFGRQGVPLNVVFSSRPVGSAETTPTVLPAVLTPTIVMDALTQAVS